MESSTQSTNGVQQAAYTPHLIPTDQEQYALPERASAAPLQGVDSEVGTQPALTTAPVDCQVLSHTFASAGESALFCFQSGYRVVPFDPASRCPAMGFDEWLEGLSEEKVISHWEQYPDHDVGCLVDADSIVFSVEGQKASAAIREIESAHSVVPNMVVTSTTGVLHFVRCAKGTSAASESHGTDQQSGRIVVRTEDKLVMLPSCADYRVGGGQANGTSGSTEVSQAFIDAVLQHNASPAEVDTHADAEFVAPVATPVAASPTFSTTGPVEVGESGGVGVQVEPVPNSTASTGFTVSAGASLKNVSPDSKPDPSTPDAIDSTLSTIRPVEAGESGDIGIQAGTVPASTASADFTGFEAPSLKNMNLDSDLPVPVDPTFSAIGAVESGETGESGVPSAALVTVPTVLNDDQTFGYTWDDDVLTPKAAENPVITALRIAGLYLNPLGSGEHSITCPWAHEHGDGSGDHATYYEPNEFNSTGGFRCQHPHLERHTAKDLLELLGVPKTQAMHKPLIRIITGDLHCVVAASEKVLEDLRRYYQAGGMLVSIITDPSTGDPRILPTTLQALTGALSAAAVFEKFDGRSGGWVTCDPPTRHVGILYKQQDYRYLSPLVGLARQPFFREIDGALVTQPGYDKASQRFGVFDPSQFVIPEPTKEAALAALAMLMELLCEFRFDKDCDKSAALSAIFTATVRPSLPQAPAFHVTSVIYGSGKSYLCKLISCFAGPADSVKISFASTSDEATKSLMSVLVKNPAVVEFDDMTSDWIAHGIINRMLTSENLTDRILGFSKTATVSTRALFLSSGNNVRAVGDLLRRIISVYIDPGCETPTTIVYEGQPVEVVRQNRAFYVAAVLTIILAWRNAGSPRADVSPIASYGGAWADYCRHPLIWLGLPDPATSLLEQVTHDPDSDALGVLMIAWYKLFGSKPTTVRKVIATADGDESLRGAIDEAAVVDRGQVNPYKLGNLLKRNANRIVGSFKFVEARADGRKAWSVVPVGTPASTHLPTPAGPVTKTVVPTSGARKDFDPLDDY